MSGSGGGGGGSTPDDIVDCASISFKTILNSPNSSVIAQLKPSDILKLKLKSPTGPLVAITKEGKEAGSITSAMLARLIECITGGHKYIAKVIEIDGGKCEVHVSAEPGV